MSIIQVKNLVKKYKKAKRNSVDGISFAVQEGELFAFLGPNGAGKTTTISILTTTLAKTNGQVQIAGFDLDRNQREIRSKIGIIFQNPSLDLNLTAEENVRLHAILYGAYSFAPSLKMMPESYQNRFQELAELLNLQNDLNKPVKDFSGGMKRKLEIMRSLTHNPKILFLDEPTTGLDPVSRKNVWDYLNQVRQQQTLTIFLTTHYLDEAEQADKVLIINHGRLVLEGTPADIKNQLTDRKLILEASEPEQLKKELHALRAKFEQVKNQFLIEVETTSRLQSLLQQIRTPLDDIHTYQPTLEQAYIQILEK